MEDKIIETPFTSEEPFTLKAIANSQDYFTAKASKMFEVPWGAVTDEQRAEAKKLLISEMLNIMRQSNHE